MARRRRKRQHEGLGLALMTGAGAAWIAAVSVAAVSGFRCWVVLALAGAGVLAFLFGLVLYFGVPFRQNRLAIRISPSGGLNVVSELPADHPRKLQDEGMVLLSAVRFTSLEPDDVSLEIELIVDFPDAQEPLRLPRRRHPDDLPIPINLTPSNPAISGDISFDWNWERTKRTGNRETSELFSLRIVDELTQRGETVLMLNISVTDEVRRG